MKNIAFILLTFVVSLLFTSCSKNDNDDTTVPIPVTYDSYSALKVGNYWIYENYQVDSLGNEISIGAYDSCFVESDTLINGQTYYKMFRPMQNPLIEYTYLRDSLHCIVNSSGEILFSSTDFSNNLYSTYFMASPGDTVCQIIRKMSDQNVQVATPYGALITSDAKETFYMYPNWSFNGNPRIKHVKYSKDIGVVVETLPFFASDPNYQERKLVRYHLN